MNRTSTVPPRAAPSNTPFSLLGRYVTSSDLLFNATDHAQCTHKASCTMITHLFSMQKEEVSPWPSDYNMHYKTLNCSYQR